MQYVPGEFCWAMETLSVKCVCHEPFLDLPWKGTHILTQSFQTEMMKVDRFRQICGLLVGISNLDSVSCSVKLEEYLSFLDHTLAENELTKCDLATFGTSKIFDDEHNGRALIRAVTVLDQDRSDRSWSWDQGLVPEVLGVIGPKWSLKLAEI